MQLCVYDPTNKEHIATALSYVELNKLGQNNPASIKQVYKLLSAVGYHPQASNAPNASVRILTAQLLAEREIDLKWLDDYTATTNKSDQAKMGSLLKQLANEPDPIYGEESVF